MNERDAWGQWIKELTVRVKVPVVPRRKYHAKPVEIDGVKFDSKREASRYSELKLLQQAGKIAQLEVHPSFPLQVVALHKPGPPWVIEHCGTFTADFRYLDTGTGEVTVEDVKSLPTKTTAYQLRKKIAEAIHGITVTEVE